MVARSMFAHSIALGRAGRALRQSIVARLDLSNIYSKDRVAEHYLGLGWS